MNRFDSSCRDCHGRRRKDGLLGDRFDRFDRFDKFDRFDRFDRKDRHGFRDDGFDHHRDRGKRGCCW